MRQDGLGSTTVAVVGQKLSAREGECIVYQNRKPRKAGRRSGMSANPLGLWCGVLVLGSATFMLGDKIASAEDSSWQSPTRLTYTITEEGKSYIFWGSEVKDTGEDVTDSRVEMPVPPELADAIADAVQSPTEGKLEYLIILRGNSVQASVLCHTHNGRTECHP